MSLCGVRKAVTGGLYLFINQLCKNTSSYVHPGPIIFVMKACLQGTWQRGFPQQREVVDGLMRGRSLALLPLGSSMSEW